MEHLLSKEYGTTMMVLGNEAIVRGAIEAGVDFAATYPGTPSSEIGDTLFRIAGKAGMYFEFSINEKVALEVSIAASISGLRAFTFMKHVGINVAADALMTFVYSGVTGGHVILSADDPAAHSSQNEQDNRYYAKLASMPMLEPSSPQEAKDMIKAGFELSETLELPVFLRTTTRVNHMRAPITLEEIIPPKKTGEFKKDPFRFVNLPSVARANHTRLLRQFEKAKEVVETSPFNTREDIGDSPRMGIITSGSAYNVTIDLVKDLGVPVAVLKLGFTHPFPEVMVAKFLDDMDAVIMVEELEPYMEDQVRVISQKEDILTPILGKHQGHFPLEGEYTPDVVGKGLTSALLSLDAIPEPGNQEGDAASTSLDLSVPNRPPVLCAGCAHRAAAYYIKKATKNQAIYTMDIGCYTLLIQEPLKTADALFCMGSSIGLACGFSKIQDKPVVAFIGDSTFFHSGISGLVNAVHNRHKFLLCVLDNRTTAMTGHQPHPGIEVKDDYHDLPALSITEVVKGLGVEYVREVNPLDVPAFKEVVNGALAHDGVSVIVAKEPCVIFERRRRKRAGIPLDKPYYVDNDKCIGCRICVSKFGCTAISMIDVEGHAKQKAVIDRESCSGCGVCAHVCPSDAFIQEGGQ